MEDERRGFRDPKFTILYSSTISRQTLIPVQSRYFPTVRTMSISAPVPSTEEKPICKELANLDINLFPGLKKMEPPLCRCCLKGKHLLDLCPYQKAVPEGAKVGHGFSLYCKWCFGEEFRPDAQQTCVFCDNTTKVAAENECYICGEMGDHLEQDCELAEFVDWDAVKKRRHAFPPLLYGDALDEALRRKAMRGTELKASSSAATRKQGMHHIIVGLFLKYSIGHRRKSIILIKVK